MLSDVKPGPRNGRSKRELTAIATDCFSRFGFRGSSIDRIARMAGVTKGAIYYHFRDKEALLAEAVNDRVREFESRVEAACRGVAPDEALRRILEVCQSHASSNDHPRFIITLMIEAIDTNDEVSERLRNTMRRFRSFLARVVRQGQEQGLFDPGADANRVAASYTSAVMGAEIQYYQDPESFDMSAALGVFLDCLLQSLKREPEAPPGPEEQA
ncbi:MAG: TetR/AcrR family transcriptional regulator [Candidatus Binatia bacterium]